MKNNNPLTKEIIEQILVDQPARRHITSQSHLFFFHLYFSEYTSYQTANFQRELFDMSEDDELKMGVVVAFRGSGKSTLMTMSYLLWSVLGRQQKKCVVIISQTQQQVRTHFSNIKRELEGNDLLKRDLGPFREESDEWGAYSIVIPQFNARLVAVSSEQSIRGLRHGAYRPDLIICDDVEDIQSVKTKEGRDKTYGWFKSEIIPLGDKNTKMIVVGNLLHHDSLLMRIKKSIDAKEDYTDVQFKEYPVVNDEGEILWKGKYPTMDEVEKFRIFLDDDKSWQREYMLKIVADEDQIVYPEWIQRYEELPEKSEDYRYTITAVDFAISTKSSADCTAMITAHVFGHLNDKRIYILPNPINKRLDFPDTVDEIKLLSEQRFYGTKPTIYIEDVGYQKSIIQQLHKEGVYVEGFQIQGQDKRSRLSSVTPLVRHGQVLFPKNGVDDLIQQLKYFGSEKHDDLADAFSMLLLKVMDKDYAKPVPITPEIAAILRGGGGSWYGNRSGYYSGGSYWM